MQYYSLQSKMFLAHSLRTLLLRHGKSLKFGEKGSIRLELAIISSKVISLLKFLGSSLRSPFQQIKEAFGPHICR